MGLNCSCLGEELEVVNFRLAHGVGPGPGSLRRQARRDNSHPS